VTLTKFTDCSLRMLIYLALHPDTVVSVAEMSRAYKVSPHVMVKASQLLIEKGLVKSVRGRNGGLRLAVAPGAVNVGKVVRMTEPGLELVECFNERANTCPIEPACVLKRALKRAQTAFLSTLDEQTLADFLPRAPSLIRLLKTSA
jgi:Rrf2 family transcriptional regulator, nitric oxide-sensitive transcriptional repressor